MTMRLSDDLVIAPSPKARRRAATAVLDVSRDLELLAFHVVDTHVHLLVVGARAQAARLAHRVAVSLHQRLGPLPPFEPARLRPVIDQRHLLSTFWYIHRQHQRHRLADPSLDASSAPDTLGWRLRTPRLAASVRAHLPRLDLRVFAHDLGLPTATAPALLAAELTPSAAAAVGEWCIDTRTPRHVQARLAAAHAAAPHLEIDAIASELGVLRGAVARLLRRPPLPSLVIAVLAQWALRSAPSRAASGGSTSTAHALPFDDDASPTAYALP